MSFKVITVTSEETITTAAKIVSEEINKWFDQPVLFLCSGGSSLEILNNIRLPQAMNLTIGVTDDRFSSDPSINNLLQVHQQAEFERQAKAVGATWMDSVPNKEESLYEWGARYEGQLKEWREKYPDGKIIATFGIGTDGHCVGIMTYPEDPVYFHHSFIETPRLAMAYHAGKKNQYANRMTITYPFIKRVDLAVSLITGESKRHVLHKLIEGHESVVAFPGALLRESKAAWVVTDQHR